jgi:hypothetical protein
MYLVKYFFTRLFFYLVYDIYLVTESLEKSCQAQPALPGSACSAVEVSRLLRHCRRLAKLTSKGAMCAMHGRVAAAAVLGRKYSW